MFRNVFVYLGNRPIILRGSPNHRRRRPGIAFKKKVVQSAGYGGAYSGQASVVPKSPPIKESTREYFPETWLWNLKIVTLVKRIILFWTNMSALTIWVNNTIHLYIFRE